MNSLTRCLKRQNESKKFFNYFTPAVDIKEENDEVVIVAELPGISKENLKLNIDNNTLIIEGEKEDNCEGYIERMIERHPRRFRRSFDLDESLNQSEIKASLNNGLLLITLKKSEYAKPKMIEIKSA